LPKHKQFFDVTADDVEYTSARQLLAPARLIVAALPRCCGGARAGS
jgi:hypothetical protein